MSNNTINVINAMFNFIIEDCDTFEDFIDFAEMSIENVLDADKDFDKYQWHDLRKNPEDLPKHDNQVLVKCDDLEIFPYFTAFYDGDMWVEGEFEDLRQFCFHVIAWREIEQFKEFFTCS